MIIPPMTTSLVAGSPSKDIPDFSLKMARVLRKEESVELAYTLRVTSQLRKRLIEARSETAIFQAERTIKNAEMERSMSLMAGRFSMLSRIQQSIS